MSSDAIFSYVTKLLLVLSIIVLFSVGYSAYKLIPSLYEQQPEIEFNGTHVMIKGILLKNQGLYPIDLTLEVKADGRTYSSSTSLDPGEAGELELTIPASALQSGNVTAYLAFALIPFIEAEVELPSIPYKGVNVLPIGVEVRKVGDIYEIKISYCMSSPMRNEFSLRMALLKDDQVIDSISRSYVVGPGRLCDYVILRAPPGMYTLEITYDSTSHWVPVVLP